MGCSPHRVGEWPIPPLRFGAPYPITMPMLAKVCSAAVSGIEAYPVEVEVNAGYGDTLIVIVVNQTPTQSLADHLAPSHRHPLDAWQRVEPA